MLLTSVGGFGHVLLKNMRMLGSICKRSGEGSYELPIILGRDFSGVIVAKGSAVTEYSVGDEVYGVVKPEYNGCHAEYALTYDSLVCAIHFSGVLSNSVRFCSGFFSF